MLKPALQLRLGQHLTMTPQLQQAIRLLQLPVMDLTTQLQEALEENVMLESVESEATPDFQEAEPRTTEERTPVEIADDNWRERSVTAAADRGYQAPGEPRLTQEFADQSGQTLQDHLAWQLELQGLSYEEAAVAQGLIDAVNEEGYLVDSLETIETTIRGLVPEVSADTIDAVLARLQALDPAGVGARSLSECLDIQLRQLDAETPGLPLARRLVSDHLDLVAEHQYGTLRRRLQVTEAELDEALALVRPQHPRPGLAIQSSTPEYVIPDVYVRKVDNRWLVELNGTATPEIRVNQSYASLVARGTDHSVLKTQLQEARWLVRSLEIRKDTLLKVARCIVERQQAFLEHGDEAMTPMVLRDVAEAVEMHESTISRVTTNKYMHTPRGVFEFRYFFSSYVGSQDGNELSSTAIRARIRKLIAQEDSLKPLSDSKIAKLLEADGAQVARRTVAKYREAMSIPSSSDRKRLAPR